MEGSLIDTIRITGLAARGYHGVFPQERRDGQRFVVDLELRLPFPDQDDITATVNYASVADEVVAVIEGPPCDLIETLAARIAQRCLAFPLVREVRVTVHKPEAPVSHEFADLSVSITRSNHDEPAL